MIATLVRLTAFRRTLFGLPLALAGALLPFANRGFHSSLHPLVWFWIVAAFLFARSSGMAFNQLIDRHFDARNSRTADRLVASGRVSPVIALLLGLCSLCLFLFSCWMINPLLGQLAGIPAALILLYSYTKRFTSWCHFVLGAILACAPIYAYIAVTGTLHRTPLYLGFGLALSIAASDIIYARQDLSFDRLNGLNSVVTLFGPHFSLCFAALLHLCALGLFLCVPLPLGYQLAIGALGVHYLAIHLSAWRIPADGQLTRVFDRGNTIAALLLFVGVVGGVLWERMF